MTIFTFTLTGFIIPFFSFELRVLLLNLHLQSHKICFLIVLDLIFICYHVKYFNIYVFFFSTHIFGDETLQLPLHLFKQIMNG